MRSWMQYPEDDWVGMYYNDDDDMKGDMQRNERDLGKPVTSWQVVPDRQLAVSQEIV